MSDIRTLPVLPLRDAVVFPGVPTPIAVGRPRSLRAVESAVANTDKEIFVLSQRRNENEVSPENLYTIGTIARIEQIQRTLSGIQLVLRGTERGITVRLSQSKGDSEGGTDTDSGYLEATVRPAQEMLPVDSEDPGFAGLYREVRSRAAELGQKSGLPRDAVEQVLTGLDAPGRLADLVANYLEIPSIEAQELLETLSVEERLRRVLVHVQRQIAVLDAQETIKNQVQEELGDRQREMLLREQIKAIRKELGDDDQSAEHEELRARLESLQLPEDARKEVDRELRRLERLGQESMESQVVRTFLETVAELPWNERDEEELSLDRAARILTEDHYGLDEVKDRVLEFLAVRQLHLAAAAERTEPGSEGSASADSEAADSVLTDAVPAASPEEAPSPSSAEPAASSIQQDEGSSPATARPVDGSGEQASSEANDERRSPILLFVGPPGVGKTSIAKSIARAMGRTYVRIALGGTRDESEIRGHRRTYVGAMPGRIVQSLKQAGAKNPVFLLDEIDKLGVSYQGDPASALLEVLDPAQNDTFTDHYLGIPFDLSEVMFIATANFVQNIPAPLLDRMEVVEFSGYTEEEKLHIAKRYLLPRQLRRNGLSTAASPQATASTDLEEANLEAASGTEQDAATILNPRLELQDEALQEVITSYTREAGVRQLERELGRLARKVARKVATGQVESASLLRKDVRPLLGRPRIHPERAAGEDQLGVATGMYYTPSGGDIMFVEASTMPGKGELVLTGQLGDVMKESARAAWTYARAHHRALRLERDQLSGVDVHVHVPAGAIPKDGPSAGITLATALISALSSRPARHDIAMTGEITLTGRVLPIGGVKEKILGGVRAGIRQFVLPRQNEADLEDLPASVREEIQVHLVSELGEVLALTLRDANFLEGRLLFGDEGPEDVIPLSESAH
ncbi:MAG: S16 family serine protease [Acidobacteriota bacterium]